MAHLECRALGVDEPPELGRRDELVLGARNQVGEAVRRTAPGADVVVQEVAQLGPELAQEQALADVVEQVLRVREAELGAVVAQQPIAEEWNLPTQTREAVLMPSVCSSRFESSLAARTL